MIKKYLLGIITGILLTSVCVYAISIKSTNVTFTPEDSEWDVKSVEDALNNLHDISNNLSSNNFEVVYSTRGESGGNS